MSKRLYLYAILDAPIAIDDVTGVTDEPLSLLRGPDCWLATGWIASARSAEPVAKPEATATALRAQDAAVRLLASRAEALLPVRFGTSFENETALQERLARFNNDRVRNALARVRGCEQMTVRAFQTPTLDSETRAESPRAEPLSGTAYLTQRAAARATTLPVLLQPVRDALAAIIRDELLDPAQRPPLLGSAYHLIARGDADRYRAAIASVPARPDITLRVTGPSPAYAFAKDALS